METLKYSKLAAPTHEPRHASGLEHPEQPIQRLHHHLHGDIQVKWFRHLHASGTEAQNLDKYRRLTERTLQEVIRQADAIPLEESDFEAKLHRGKIMVSANHMLRRLDKFQRAGFRNGHRFSSGSRPCVK
jgi:hypothetical protein